MRTRANHGKLRGLATGILALGILFLWVVPGDAIEVVRDKAKTVDKQPKSDPEAKKTGDTATISTRSLLHDVRSQKQSGSATDSLDTWIDRDGDGINDHLRKSTAPPKTKIKSRGIGTSNKRPPKQPTTPSKTVVKKRHTTGKDTKSKATPQAKKPKSTVKTGTKKKDPR